MYLKSGDDAEANHSPMCRPDVRAKCRKCSCVFVMSAVVRAHGCTRASYDENDRHRKTREKRK